MDIADIIHRIGETVSAGSTVKNVYGEPVSSCGRTVIPVAKVRFAFGGGGGGERKGDHPRPGGGGGGGRGSAQPYGVVELTPEGVRFHYFDEREKLAGALAIGFLAGLVVGWTMRQKPKSL